MADHPRHLLRRAAAHLGSLQRDSGEWEGEVIWCTMILSQYVIVRHVTGRALPEEERRRIIRHYAIARTADGGWPLHPEGPAQIFTTTLAYVALRMLGVTADDEVTRGAAEWLRRQKTGVVGIPTWGKFWLSLLDLYGAEGVGAFPPELFLLPRWIPGHPDGWYCHTRYIYLGMAYLSGGGFTADLGPLRDALRAELYLDRYDAIDFSAHLNDVASADLYATPAFALRAARRGAPILLRLRPADVRERALRHCFTRILDEQRASRYQALSPVNGLLNCLAIHATDATHPELEPSLAGLEAWRWSDAERGTRYAGARSHVWDTAFAARALVDAGSLECETATATPLKRAHAYLKAAQLTDDLPGRDRNDRDAIRGGWCFSDGAHRWPVSDCTAEALTAILEIERLPGVIGEAERVTRARVKDGLVFLLARQNADGGFSTYERQRAGTWLDRFNASEMFRDCMTERSYVECTASAVEAIATVRIVYPDLVSAAEEQALQSAIAFLRRTQRADGTFPAAWGINLTYSIFHVTKALRAAGIDRNDAVLVRAAAWLRSTQRADGGWGEHFSGCLEGRYVEHPRSQAVMTAWALLALADIDPASDAITRGVAWLESAQQADGSWPPEAVNGVFFGTAMLEYAHYVAYFPAWALARCARRRRLPPETTTSRSSSPPHVLRTWK